MPQKLTGLVQPILSTEPQNELLHNEIIILYEDNEWLLRSGSEISETNDITVTIKSE